MYYWHGKKDIDARLEREPWHVRRDVLDALDRIDSIPEEYVLELGFVREQPLFPDQNLPRYVAWLPHGLYMVFAFPPHGQVPLGGPSIVTYEFDTIPPTRTPPQT